jgi:type II secretory ATPase GspE/PulE/Tfp pilus assembly ATPase PilB-like protein
MAVRFFSEPMMNELGVSLVGQNHLMEATLSEVQRRASLIHSDLHALLLAESLVAEETVLHELSGLSGIPFRRVTEFKITAAAVAAVPARTALHYNVAPVAIEEQSVTLATSRVPDAAMEASLQSLLNCSVSWVLSTRLDVEETLKHLYGLGAQAVHRIVGTLDGRGRDASQDTVDVSDLVEEFIREAVHAKASDIHLHVEADDDTLRMRFRVDGVLHAVPLPPGIQRLQKAILSCIKVMAHLNISEKRQPQDGRIDMRIGPADYDLRVSVLPAISGEAINIRILDRETALLSLQELGLQPSHIAVLSDMVALPHGIVLLTGPTGSGKTTSLYALLASLKDTSRSIITLEDPVEYKVSGVVQIQANPKIQLDFASGLRSILRHDPDVILVGEISDAETAEIAIRAALTGHLVLSTLHTNDSVGAIIRLVDMGIEPYLVASALHGAVAQRLIRKICLSCRREVPLDDVVRAEVSRLLPEYPSPLRAFKGDGCPDCKFTGYKGRCAIIEIMTVTDAIRRLIVRGADKESVQKAALDSGMRTLRHSGWQLVLDGVASVEDVFRLSGKVGR